jgi:hypothetical protein
MLMYLSVRLSQGATCMNHRLSLLNFKPPMFCIRPPIIRAMKNGPITGRSFVTHTHTHARIYIYIYRHTHTVRSESRCARRLRSVDLAQARIDAGGHHFQHLL